MALHVYAIKGEMKFEDLQCPHGHLMSKGIQCIPFTCKGHQGYASLDTTVEAEEGTSEDDLSTLALDNWLHDGGVYNEGGDNWFEDGVADEISDLGPVAEETLLRRQGAARLF